MPRRRSTERASEPAGDDESDEGGNILLTR